jgi:hypothetical protein
MLAGSFRLVVPRLFPRGFVHKQPLLLGAVILAGCGGSGSEKPPQRVSGPGFRFDAPAGWVVQRTRAGVSASHGSELVQVATFRLVKPYSAALFSRVARELTARMRTVAAQTGGKVVGRDVVRAAGIRSHSYRVDVGDHVDEYTFVLRGTREHQLLCRRRSSHDDDICRLLISSFRWR